MITRDTMIPPTVLSDESAREQIRQAEERYRRQLAGALLDLTMWSPPIVTTALLDLTMWIPPIVTTEVSR